MEAANEHARRRKLFGTPDQRSREREGLGDFVPTEVEKDSLKRSRSITPTQAAQDSEACPRCEELGYLCDECNEAITAAAQMESMSEAFGRQPAGKGPLYRQMDVEEEEIEEEPEPEVSEGEADPAIADLPDLHQYFMQWPNVGDDAVISMCRAYASYLASLSKKKIFKRPQDPSMNKKRRTHRTK